ncbi:hypothetical protein C6I20_11095 [Aeromicrobium sp. A1-2]|uniref:FHA domain-containing protein n=1 Tax=Aeromicrobium sp. A1-2 TaxID=2107713 RepID=UPI000E536BC8|nr:FHA domain-containing protein [Aeromicrobium sp. A1-2]AXT85681.1 hypothetical protein C6I20_11095 [Aeromicrobium sp. A1-2]
MDWQIFRVCVSPGDAVVVREGAAVVVAHPIGDSHEGFLDELMAVLHEDAQQLKPAAGGTLRHVAALVTQSDSEAVPSLGLLTAIDGDIVALLVGRMRLRITRSGEVEEWSGHDATTYVERRVRGEFDQLMMAVTPDDIVPDLRSNLHGGVVRGSGVLLIPAGRSIPTDEPDEPDETMIDPALTVPEPQPQPQPQPAYTPISLVEPDAPSETPEIADPPAAIETSSVRQAVQVQGIVCSRGHFTRHDARFCSQCGISMVHQTHNLVMGDRPPLGVLVTDDGSVFPLSCDYVIGREPETSDAVVSRQANPLPLDDEGGSMSRIHARILLDGWEVRVVDANSANGSFLTTASGPDWIRLEPGVPCTIAPGTQLSMGGRTLTFESHQRL